MTETPQPLPARGGSYIRDAKGALKPAPPEPAAPAPKPAVKEA